MFDTSRHAWPQLKPNKQRQAQQELKHKRPKHKHEQQKHQLVNVTGAAASNVRGQRVKAAGKDTIDKRSIAASHVMPEVVTGLVVTGLEHRIATEEPGRQVRDIPKTGSCFFLAANLGLQDLLLMGRTSSEKALVAAALDDRASVISLMKERLEHRLSDGDTIYQKLQLQALVLDERDPPFPGEAGCAVEL